MLDLRSADKRYDQYFVKGKVVQKQRESLVTSLSALLKAWLLLYLSKNYGYLGVEVKPSPFNNSQLDKRCDFLLFVSQSLT